jgi:hypothetical protein
MTRNKDWERQAELEMARKEAEAIVAARESLIGRGPKRYPGDRIVAGAVGSWVDEPRLFDKFVVKGSSGTAVSEDTGVQQQAIIHTQMDRLEAAAHDAGDALEGLCDKLSYGGVLAPAAPSDKKGDTVKDDRTLEVPMAEHLRSMTCVVHALAVRIHDLIERLGV